MVSISSLQTPSATNLKHSSRYAVAAPLRSTVLSTTRTKGQNRPLTVVAAVGDVSAVGTNYLIAGAALVALVGTAFPIIFSRKESCPECDGAGFVRKAGSTLSQGKCCTKGPSSNRLC